MKLENQLCFPIYACSREIIKAYNPLLQKLDLTYTQYIVMLVLWEHHTLSVKEVGEKLYLDSGTLTPLLKKLEAKGLLTRERSAADERSVLAGQGWSSPRTHTRSTMRLPGTGGCPAVRIM